MQRALTLHTDNTVVDNSGTADIRRLTSAWTTYAITAVVNNNQGTNSERRFDPETGGDTTVSNASSATDGKGFAVPTADMATVDAACVPSLAAQNMTLTFSVNFFGSGAGTGGSDVWTPRASLWKWNTSTDTGTLIVGGSGTAVSRTGVVAAYGPELKSGSVTLSVPATTFGANEVLMLVSGGNLAAAAGLGGGARSFAVRLNTAASPLTMVFATSGLLQSCTESLDCVGEGALSRVMALAMSDDAVGEGTPTMARVVSAAKSFDLIGEAVPTMTRLVTAARSYDLVGEGTPSRDGLVVGLPRDTVGEGTPTMSRVVEAAKSFDLVGEGVPTRGAMELTMADDVVGEGEVTFTKPLTAARSFDVVGEGEVTGRIELPLGDVPEDGGGTTVIKRPIYLFDD